MHVTKAEKEYELVETKETKEATMLELERLPNYNAELHQSSDFAMKNFDVRQTECDEEIEALNQAKSYSFRSQVRRVLGGC